MDRVPTIRIRQANKRPVSKEGHYILYWMIAARRLHYNFALDRALEYSRELDKPLFIFEALRVGYQWASDRLHRFVLDGMAENAAACADAGVRYYPYVEPQPGSGKGLLTALAEQACVVITDDFPCFFLPRMVASAAKQLSVLLETVDSNGLLPMYATDQVAQRAFDFRRLLQRELPHHLSHSPDPNPLSALPHPAIAVLPRKIASNWPAASKALLCGDAEHLKAFPIDHSVAPAARRGGHAHAKRQMIDFLDHKLSRYAEQRNEPELEIVSGLSPYLHFGHLSMHEVFASLAHRERWTPEKLALRGKGSREGWWNMSPAAENFLDEIITWREVGYNFCAHRGDYDKYDSLPDWVRKTLHDHSKDTRDPVYALKELEAAQTYDPLWNASQLQLVREGSIHNYLRMLWGKKILQWTKSPQEALKIMVHLNNKYALDGRNPNTYTGIFWVLGRYDRPWAPTRPIFGSIRYMSSENTARKVRVKRLHSQVCAAPDAQTQLTFKR